MSKKDQDSTSSLESSVQRQSLGTDRQFIVVSREDYPMMADATRPLPRMKGTIDSILESFTDMCSCTPQFQEVQRSTASRQVYPVERFANYPALNTRYLVEKRREDFRDNLFRPVSEDEALNHCREYARFQA
jgi:hypothetical protein